MWLYDRQLLDGISQRHYVDAVKTLTESILPVRFDRHIGAIETLEPKRTDEGFLKVHGIVARAGVLHYEDATGKVSAELIPPEELFKKESLETLGGKPFTDDHPRDANGAPLLVNSDNSEEHTKGTVGNDIVANKATGFVRITIDAHQASIIAKIDKGKRQLSSGRLVDRIDETPGVWNASSQLFWTGDAAIGKKGVRFDRIQRGLRHNHVALVDRGRAGPRVSLRMDSADAVQVEPPDNGGLPMAKVRIDGAEFEVDSGAAAAITAQQTAHKTRVDGLDTQVKTLEAEKVKAEAERDLAKVKADELETKLAGINPKEMVKARLDLERSVAHLKLDGVGEMTDRAIRVAVIKSKLPKYEDKDVSDEDVNVYFDAVLAMAGETPATRNDGSAGLNSAAHDSAPVNTDLDKKRADYIAGRGYKALLAQQKGGQA